MRHGSFKSGLSRGKVAASLRGVPSHSPSRTAPGASSPWPAASRKTPRHYRSIRADARVMGATVKAGERVTIELDPKRHAYLVPAIGTIEVGGVRIEARDGAAITDVAHVEIVGVEDAEVVLVDAA